MPQSLTLYTKTGCPWCREARDFLDARGYRYEEIDVRANPERMQELLDVSGQSLAPTMTVGDLLLADFGSDELARFLDQHGITP